MTVGHTLGEEILFGVKVRTETVKAVDEACLMQVPAKALRSLKT
jgi:CRP-like cAMP-binding protein